jgi:hypothetical protein
MRDTFRKAKSSLNRAAVHDMVGSRQTADANIEKPRIFPDHSRRLQRRIRQDRMPIYPARPSQFLLPERLRRIVLLNPCHLILKELTRQYKSGNFFPVA